MDSPEPLHCGGHRNLTLCAVVPVYASAGKVQKNLAIKLLKRSDTDPFYGCGPITNSPNGCSGAQWPVHGGRLNILADFRSNDLCVTSISLRFIVLLLVSIA